MAFTYKYDYPNKITQKKAPKFLSQTWKKNKKFDSKGKTGEPIWQD